MPIFTKAEDLFPSAEQSVGGNPTEGGNGNESVRIFQPDRGLDVLIQNVSYLDREEGDFSTGIVEDNDGRKALGTITLNNRDFWENSNYNEDTFGPYLTGLREVVDGQEVVDVQMYSQTNNGNVTRRIVVNDRRSSSPTFQFSIDAIPFVINPNNDEIVRVDRYYDKNIDTEKYNLATEGKINYYIYPRGDGRTPAGNIDTYGYKGLKTQGGKNRFDVYAEEAGPDAKGYSIFRLDWGDGTPLEHTRRPKILEGTTLLEHIYKKPGFYTIKGVVMAFDGFNIGGWEKFETNILINASDSYDVNLYNDRNFATIGGISPDSVLVKSATDIVGVNPLTLDDSKASSESIENINLFDRLNLFNFLSKVDFNIVNKFSSDMLPYSIDIFDEPDETLIEGFIFGCLDPQSDNYQPNADSDLSGNRTLCEYDLQINFDAQSSGDNKITIYFVNQESLDSILEYPPEDEPDYFYPFEDGFDQDWANQNQGFMDVAQLNPSRTPGRRQAIINAIGSSWIDANQLESFAYQKYTIYTNPSSGQNNIATINRDTLLQASRILIKGEPVNTSQNYDNAEINFSVESPSDVGGLSRNPISLDGSNLSVKVVKSYQAAVNPDLSYSNLYATAPDYVRQGTQFQYNGSTPASSNYNIENLKMSTLFELNPSDLQNVGSTVSGGINGLHTINLSVFVEGDGGSGNNGNGGGSNFDTEP